MKIAGIVAEYNPFHLGHRYQIDCLREMGYEGIVVAMSGNFVQRADVALTDKYFRAQAAVRGGADLILELPLPYALASAEDFATGGIQVLTATGMVDAVSCGCESGNEKNLRQYRTLCQAETLGKIREKMREGLSYPAACKSAVIEMGEEWSEGANDVLALAYRKALDRIAPEIPLVAIQRKGDFHDYRGTGFESAESIRKRLRRGEDVTESLPEGAYESLKNQPLADLTRLERGILAYYRTASPQTLKAFYGMREGLAERICKQSDAASSEELYERVKTKRFPHSAVRRAVLCGYLQIPASLPEISYLRVLAFNEKGQEILRKMKERSTLPVVSSLSPQMREDPRFSLLTNLQLRGDEFFAATLPTPPKRFADLTETGKKISIFGE